VPVVTAHPTEAVRRSVLDHVNGVAMALDALDGPPPGSPRHATLVASMRRDMELLWQTEELRTVRPTVLDEARDIRFHLDLLMDVVPAVHAELDRRWVEVFGGLPHPSTPSSISAPGSAAIRTAIPTPGHGRSATPCGLRSRWC